MTVLLEAPSITPKMIENVVDVIPEIVVPVAASVLRGETMTETKEHRRCYERWLALHQTTKMRAGEIDKQVAQEFKVQQTTFSKWKAHFGWVEKWRNVKEAETLEDNVKLYLKNNNIEHEALDQIIRYLEAVRDGEVASIDINMMKSLVDFAKKNKLIINAPPDAPNTLRSGNTNVNFVIKG